MKIFKLDPSIKSQSSDAHDCHRRRTCWPSAERVVPPQNLLLDDHPPNVIVLWIPILICAKEFTNSVVTPLLQSPPLQQISLLQPVIGRIVNRTFLIKRVERWAEGGWMDIAFFPRTQFEELKLISPPKSNWNYHKTVFQEAAKKDNKSPTARYPSWIPEHRISRDSLFGSPSVWEDKRAGEGMAGKSAPTKDALLIPG